VNPGSLKLVLWYVGLRNTSTWVRLFCQEWSHFSKIILTPWPCRVDDWLYYYYTTHLLNYDKLFFICSLFSSYTH
jgi:hypothetical protein